MSKEKRSKGIGDVLKQVEAVYVEGMCEWADRNHDNIWTQSFGNFNQATILAEKLPNKKNMNLVYLTGHALVSIAKIVSEQYKLMNGADEPKKSKMEEIREDMAEKWNPSEEFIAQSVANVEKACDAWAKEREEKSAKPKKDETAKCDFFDVPKKETKPEPNPESQSDFFSDRVPF